MVDSEALYRAVGQRIRKARGANISQEKLAKMIHISRASVVNIEAGRQHAPLYLLWNIAEALKTDLTLLLPRRDEMLSVNVTTEVDNKTKRKIELAVPNDPERQRNLAGTISKLRTVIESTPNTKATKS